jgi:hypothetical protein
MRSMPGWMDKAQWMLDNPREYFTFARHLAEQFAYYSRTGKRKPMHRVGSEYWKDGTRG